MNLYKCNYTESEFSNTHKHFLLQAYCMTKCVDLYKKHYKRWNSENLYLKCHVVPCTWNVTNLIYLILLQKFWHLLGGRYAVEEIKNAYQVYRLKIRKVNRFEIYKTTRKVYTYCIQTVLTYTIQLSIIMKTQFFPNQASPTCSLHYWISKKEVSEDFYKTIILI